MLQRLVFADNAEGIVQCFTDTLFFKKVSLYFIEAAPCSLSSLGVRMLSSTGPFNAWQDLLAWSLPMFPCSDFVFECESIQRLVTNSCRLHGKIIYPGNT